MILNPAACPANIFWTKLICIPPSFPVFKDLFCLFVFNENYVHAQDHSCCPWRPLDLLELELELKLVVSAGKQWVCLLQDEYLKNYLNPFNSQIPVCRLFPELGIVGVRGCWLWRQGQPAFIKSARSPVGQSSVCRDRDSNEEELSLRGGTLRPSGCHKGGKRNSLLVFTRKSSVESILPPCPFSCWYMSPILLLIVNKLFPLVWCACQSFRTW